MKPTLDDLLSCWQEAPDSSLEELCRDQPDLLPALRERIAILQKFEQLASVDVVVPLVDYPFPIENHDLDLKN